MKREELLKEIERHGVALQASVEDLGSLREVVDLEARELELCYAKLKELSEDLEELLWRERYGAGSLDERAPAKS